MKNKTLPIYSSWDHVPKDLHTKSQLAKMGLKPAKHQVAVALKKNQMYKYGDDYLLYELEAAIPKRSISVHQQEALAKARQKSRESITCQRCGLVSMRNINQLCEYCEKFLEREADRQEAIEWAQKIVANPYTRILDSESTGLDTEAEIIEVSIINIMGNVLFHSLFRPTIEIDPGATAIHGYLKDDLVNAPTIIEMYEPLIKAIAESGPLVIYNEAFDWRLLQQTFRRYGLPAICPVIRRECAMLWYSQYVGDWSKYYGSYKWQSLRGGDHTATGDCLAALETIKWMAQ